MADDLVKRLNDKWRHSEELCYEAAAEIERLREALQPFADLYSDYAREHYGDDVSIEMLEMDGLNDLTVGHVRRASAALNKTEEDDA